RGDIPVFPPDEKVKIQAARTSTYHGGIALRPPRFKPANLLAIVAFCGVTFTLVRSSSAPWAGAVFTAAFAALALSFYGRGAWRLFWVGFAACGFSLWLVPIVQSARRPDCRRYCDPNLKAIALALRTYHSDFGCYPPAYVADRRGRPLYSWRVLLLPY